MAGDGYDAGRWSLGTTRWSLVRRAASGGKPLEEWVEACWYPLYAWARGKKCDPEDAADAVQDFLSKICSKNLLAQADPSRGKFRSWVLAAFGNHLTSRWISSRAQKRGGGATHLPLDLDGIEEFYLADMAEINDPEKVYTRAWALSLMDEALVRLSRHFEADGREALFEALLPALEAPFADSTYERVGEKLGMNTAAVRQAALRFRQRYRRMLLEVASERLGITSEAQLREELRDLLGG